MEGGMVYGYNHVILILQGDGGERGKTTTCILLYVVCTILPAAMGTWVMAEVQYNICSLFLCIIRTIANSLVSVRLAIQYPVMLTLKNIKGK